MGSDNMGHDEQLKDYVKSPHAPVGEWHLNVPVGLEMAKIKAKKAHERWNSSSEQQSQSIWGEITTVPTSVRNSFLNECKEIDAVCIKSNDYRQSNFKNIDRSSYFSRSSFDNEDIVLIEVKTRKDGIFKGIGQLTAYETHIKRDWNPNSVSKILLSAKIDDFIKIFHKESDIQIVTVKK